MEREARPQVPKLVDVVGRDFPDATAVRLSFPELWEYVETVRTAASPLYIAGFPIERAFHGREHFEGLAPEINVNLVFYRLYKFFQPWPLPEVTVEWSPVEGHGRVTDVRGYDLQLHPVGQAQAWFGVDYGVLWECYLEGSHRSTNWQDTLANIWKVVEKDIGTPTLFTPPHEPAFGGSYIEYLRKLGYREDAGSTSWWSKQGLESRASVLPEN